MEKYHGYFSTSFANYVFCETWSTYINAVILQIFQLFAQITQFPQFARQGVDIPALISQAKLLSHERIQVLFEVFDILKLRIILNLCTICKHPMLKTFADLRDEVVRALRPQGIRYNM